VKDLLDDRLRHELQRLVDGKSASPLVRQRVQHRLDRAPRSRAMVVLGSAAAVVLLIAAVVALAGGSSSKPTHVASRGATTAPPGSALAPEDVAPAPASPSQRGSTANGVVAATPTTSVTPTSRPQKQSPHQGATTTVAPGSHGFAPPPTTSATTPQPPRAAPSVTDSTGPYAVEVIGRYGNDGGPVGWFRRTDDRGSTIGGPDAYGAMTFSAWGGTPGPRYLSMGAVGNASQGSEAGRIFVYGAVGTDAVRVDLVLGDGRTIPATLGTQTVGPLHFWVVGYWPDAPDYGKAVATDAHGNTWQIDGGGAGFGYTP
jgi:hypothetical protein